MMKTKHTFEIAMVLLSFSTLISTFSTPARAEPGGLDPSFGGTGMIRVGFGFGADFGRAVAVQADRKLIVAGSSGTNDSFAPFGDHFSLVRLDTNNLPDLSFGFDGKVMTPVCAAGLDFAHAAVNAVKIQADGRIVAAGYAYTGTHHPDFTLVRYNPNGSLDTSFGPNGTGIVYTDFGVGDGSIIRDMVIQSDGKIVVAGHTYYSFGNAGEGAVALARYQTNGTLDLSFGNGGKQITEVVGGYTGAHALMIQNDGKIVASGIGIGSGHTGVDFALYRYTTNGLLDGEFRGGTGKVFTQIAANNSPGFHYFDSANAVALFPGNNTIQNPDRIVVAGTYRNHDVFGHSVIALARYRLDGTLDPTFGNGGIVTNAVGPGFSEGCAMVVQSSGFLTRKILVAGHSISEGTRRFVLVRYTADGSFDATFNGTGQVITPIGPSEDEANAIVFQAGKIVVAGSSRVNPLSSDFALARYNIDGSPDMSFDGDGILTTGVADRSVPAKAVAIQADDKLVVAGYADNGTREVLALTRINPDGSPDFSFGVNSKMTTSIGEGSARANAVVIQPDGKIVAAGYAQDDFAVVRYDANGSPDASFGLNGIMTTPLGNGSSGANSIAFQSDGRIVVAGSSYNGVNSDFAVVRYTTNGFPDASFGDDGKVITPIGSKDEIASAVAMQADGKIVVAGSSVIGTSVDIAVVRYHSNGSLDNSFGTLGRVVTDIGAGSLDFAHALAIQPNGRILIGGVSADGPIKFAVVRYDTNGVPDSSFGNDGKVTTSIGLGLDDYGYALALQNDGKIVLAGASTVGGSQFSAVRYHANGSLDNSFGTGGKVIAEFANSTPNVGYALALDSLGRAVIAGDAGGLFGVVRLLGDVLEDPALSISLTTTNTAVISWPYPSTGWNLQQNTDPATQNWVAPSEPVNNNGTDHFIIVGPSTGTRLYRLSSP